MTGIESKLADAKAELRTVITAFFAEIEKRMDLGDDFESAVMAVCKAHPDLIRRENTLRDHIKALAGAEEGLSGKELLAWCGLRSKGAISCAAVSRLASAARRLPIAQLGVRYKGKQRIEITRPMLAEVVANFRKRDTGEVPIDYDHAIEMAAGDGGPVPAAGWIKSIDDLPDAEGILWGTVEWTPKAAAMIKAGEYKYVSPVIDPSVRDNKTGESQGWTLTSAALTNQPVLQGMPPLVLSEGGRGEVGRESTVQATNEWDAVNVEICDRVKQVMAAKGLTYAATFETVRLSDRDLARRYSAARVRYLAKREVGARSEDRNEVFAVIQPLVREKLAANEGGNNYQSALRAVLSEHPDLARRYKPEFRS